MGTTFSSPLPAAGAWRRWLLLLPVVLGAALYSVSFPLRFAPQVLPFGMKPAIMAAMWGPLAAVLLLALLWVLLGPASLKKRLLSTPLLALACAGAVAAAHPDTRFFF